MCLLQLFQCVATLSTFYWRSSEESVEGDHPYKAPVLESRGTVSRADQIQGMLLRKNSVTTILSFFIQINAANKTDSSSSFKSITVVLLIAMVILTSTGCLQHVYMQNLREIKPQQLNSS